MTAGGILVFDVFIPWIDIINIGYVEQCSRFRLESGEIYIVYTKHMIDRERQLHTFDFIHTPYKQGDIRYHHTINYRYVWKEELCSTLLECGFEIVHFDDKFNFGKYYAVIAKKRR